MNELRPLPLHLANAQMCWGSASQAASLYLADGLVWHPELGADAADLAATIQGHPSQQFLETVSRLAANRLKDLLAGVEAYQSHDWIQAERDRHIIWQRGSVHLYDYGDPGEETTDRNKDRQRNRDSADAQPRTVLLVPSMINASDILDLMPGRSLVHYMRAAGLRPVLLDWGDRAGDTAHEQAFDLGQFVADRLVPALTDLADRSGGPVDVVGYCMGGTLALAAATMVPDAVASLSLLASPFDFHAGGDQAPPFLSAMQAIVAAGDARCPVPVDVLQLYFTALDPTLNDRKFRRFAHMDPDSEDARFFVAMERWANGGAAMPRAVAADCLHHWYAQNLLARGAWHIGDHRVVPDVLTCPVFVAAPQNDRLVPTNSALAAAAHFANPTVISPASGHVGMIVGSGAEAGLWRPLVHWLQRRSHILPAV